MMRRKLLTVMVIIGWLPIMVSAQNDDQATAILAKVSEKYQNLNGFKAVFEYAYSSEDDGLIQSNTGEVTVKGDKYRLVLDDQEIFNNGETVWTLIKSSRYKEVTINSVEENSEELTPSNIYDIYKKGYTATLLGEGEEGGRPVYEILLTAEKPTAQFQRIKLFVDKVKYDLLAWEINDDTGGVFKYTFKDLNNDINVMDDYFVFNTQTNQDVEVIDLR